MQIEPIYQLTKEQYEDLLKVKENPDIMLRETNTTLKKKVDELQAKLDKGSFDNIRVQTPFIVTNEALCMHTPSDFILLYNSLAKATLKDSDKFIFEYLTNLAESFNYKPQFSDSSKLKAYRVSLQKKDICQPVKMNGLIYLKTSKES